MQQHTESNKETMPAVSLRNALAFIGCLVVSGLAASLIVGMAHDDMVGWFSHNKAHHHHAAKTQEMMVNPHTEEARLVLAQLAYEEQKAEEEAFNKGYTLELDEVLPEMPDSVVAAMRQQHEQDMEHDVEERSRHIDNEVPSVPSGSKEYFTKAAQEQSKAVTQAQHEQDAALKSRRDTESSEHQEVDQEKQNAYEETQFKKDTENEGDEVVKESKEKSKIEMAKAAAAAADAAQTESASSDSSSSSSSSSSESSESSSSSESSTASGDKTGGSGGNAESSSTSSASPADAKSSPPIDINLLEETEMQHAVRKIMRESSDSKHPLVSEQTLEAQARDVVKALYEDRRELPPKDGSFLKGPTEFGPWLLN